MRSPAELVSQAHSEKLVDWREVVSGPHFFEGATFLVVKGRDGRSGYVVLCPERLVHVYLDMTKPVMVAVREVQPKGIPIGNSLLVAYAFKEAK
jgi:hypothetical protein